MGTLIATASQTGRSVKVWDAKTATLLHCFRRGNTPACIFSLSFCPCSVFLAVGSSNGTIHVFSLDDRRTASHLNSGCQGHRSTQRPVPEKIHQPLFPALPQVDSISGPSAIIGASKVLTGVGRSFCRVTAEGISQIKGIPDGCVDFVNSSRCVAIAHIPDYTHQIFRCCIKFSASANGGGVLKLISVNHIDGYVYT